MLKTIGILGVSVVTAAALLTGSAAFAGKLGEPKDIEFKASIDGTAQRYVEMLPEGFDLSKPVNVLICLHGHGSDRWQYVREIRAETKAARDIAAKYNLIYISPDYRAKTSWMGPKAEADMVQIIGLLKARYKVGKVILNGASMGGSSALTFTAMHPDMIDGICALNGTANHLEYANFQGAIQESFSGTKAAIPLEYKRRSAEYWPEAFTMPVALTAGGKDASVPPQSVLRLADILKKMGRKVLLIDRPETGHQTDYPDSTEALEFVVCSVLGLEPPAQTTAAPSVSAMPAATAASGALLIPTQSAVTGEGGVFFSGQDKPAVEANGHAEIGLKFQATENGKITAVQFYKASGEKADTHTLRLWDAGGGCLAKLESTGETPSGWQRIVLTEPLKVKAGEVYTLSYTAISRYPGTAAAFVNPIERRGIKALTGVYSFGKIGEAPPDKTYKNMSYWLDIGYEVVDK